MLCKAPTVHNGGEYLFSQKLYLSAMTSGRSTPSNNHKTLLSTSMIGRAKWRIKQYAILVSHTSRKAVPVDVDNGLITTSSENLSDLTQEENGRRSSGSRLETRHYFVAMTTHL